MISFKVQICLMWFFLTTKNALSFQYNIIRRFIIVSLWNHLYFLILHKQSSIIEFIRLCLFNFCYSVDNCRGFIIKLFFCFWIVHRLIYTFILKVIIIISVTVIHLRLIVLILIHYCRLFISCDIIGISNSIKSLLSVQSKCCP